MCVTVSVAVACIAVASVFACLLVRVCCKSRPILATVSAHANLSLHNKRAQQSAAAAAATADKSLIKVPVALSARLQVRDQRKLIANAVAPVKSSSSDLSEGARPVRLCTHTHLRRENTASARPWLANELALHKHTHTHTQSGHLQEPKNQTQSKARAAPLHASRKGAPLANSIMAIFTRSHPRLRNLRRLCALAQTQSASTCARRAEISSPARTSARTPTTQTNDQIEG